MSNLVVSKPQIITTAKKALIRSSNFISKQSPIILAGTAIVGVGTTAVLASKAGIRANDILKEKRNEKGEELSASEMVQATWKVYVPTVISAGLTIGAIVASSAISQKRQAALASLYALSEGALKEYQEKVEKELGPKQAQHILDEVNADKVRNDTAPWDVDALPTGKVLCYDKLTGRYFRSSVQKIRSAEADINRAIYSGDMCASLNEFYGLIESEDLKPCELGEHVGWNLDADCLVYLTSALTSDMTPCLVLDWSNGHAPHPNYRDI